MNNISEIGNNIAVNKWINLECKEKSRLLEWVESDKSERVLNELFPGVEIINSVKINISLMTIGEFQDESHAALTEPDKKADPTEGMDPTRNKKNTLQFTNSNESLVVPDNVKLMLLESVKHYKNMEEFLFDKYYNAANLLVIIEGLSPYYTNTDLSTDLLEFLNKSFDYNIVRQWFVEGILILICNGTLPIIEF